MQTNIFRVRELTVKYQTTEVELAAPIGLGMKLLKTQSAATMLTQKLRDEPSEVFAILLLDMQFRLIGYHEVSRGTLDATYAHPREVFRAAILANAGGIILAHNHPSGDPTPSSLDLTMTTRLVDAGRLLGIRVHDHIIVGDGTYYSFRDCDRL